jgi:hypothetical protein
MRTPIALGIAILAALGPHGASGSLLATPAAQVSQVEVETDAGSSAAVDAEIVVPIERLASVRAHDRFAADLAAMQVYRPGYPFWQHIFTIPDGSVAYGSATDGRLLAVFPSRGDWLTAAQWGDPGLAALLRNQRLPTQMTQRREQVATLLTPAAGPVVHNATRGTFVTPNARKYGSFLAEWGEIYERFGVPAELGLAQALVESGFNPTIRSEARAVGFCQWLEGNWNALKRLAPNVIEAHNQTTQAAYCAAYLSILATKYNSFIPALSEHHAGGTNVGRTVINGARLGGQDVREQYFLGSQFAKDLREIAPNRFTDLVRTYGPRSFLYAEMVFGNMATIMEVRSSRPQEQIFAMRVPRALALDEIARRTGLSVAEIQRFNPALIRQVPAGATLYLPTMVDAFGRDVTFWRRPPSLTYSAVLNDFLSINTPPDEWDSPAFERVLRDFQRRFRETRTEEGDVMATVLAYVIDETVTSRRGPILAEYKTSPKILALFEQGVAVWNSNGRALPQAGSR